MPNWCTNRITIRGPKYKIDGLYRAIKEKDEFLRILRPVPKNLRKLPYDTGLPAPKKKLIIDGWERLYDWYIENWGTKWDISTKRLKKHADGEGIHGWFESAWEPPLEALAYYCDNNDDVYIKIDFIEPGRQFKGYWCSDGSSDVIKYKLKGQE